MDAVKDQLRRQYDLAAKEAAKAVSEGNESNAQYFLGIMTGLEPVIFPGGKLSSDDDSGLGLTQMRLSDKVPEKGVEKAASSVHSGEMDKRTVEESIKALGDEFETSFMADLTSSEESVSEIGSSTPAASTPKTTLTVAGASPISRGALTYGGTLPTSSGRSETDSGKLGTKRHASSPLSKEGSRTLPTSSGGSETDTGRIGSKRQASSPLSKEATRKAQTEGGSSPVDVSNLKKNLNISWKEDLPREPLPSHSKAPAACGPPPGLKPLPDYKASPGLKTLPGYKAPPSYNPPPGIKATTGDRGTPVFGVSARPQSSTPSFIKPTPAYKEAAEVGRIGAVTTQSGKRRKVPAVVSCTFEEDSDGEFRVDESSCSAEGRRPILRWTEEEDRTIKEAFSGILESGRRPSRNEVTCVMTPEFLRMNLPGRSADAVRQRLYALARKDAEKYSPDLFLETIV